MNILIIKLSAIGDVICALPVAEAIKRQWPQAKVTWIVEPLAYEILENNPNIDEIIVFHRHDYLSISGFLKRAPAFWKVIRTAKFDVSLDLQGLIRSSYIALFFAARYKFGWNNMQEGSRYISRPCGASNAGHVVEQYLDVVRALGADIPRGSAQFDICITAAEQAAALTVARAAGLDTKSGYVILAPGTNWPNKKLPASTFAAIVRYLSSQGIQPVLAGAASDANIAREITDLSHMPVINLIGHTSLKQLAFLSSKALLFVGGDTGPVHLAAAVGAKVVQFMGPTKAWRSLAYGAGNIAVEVERDCAGCYRKHCVKGYDCLATISPQQLIEAIEKALKN